jgi:hypothetical protein
LLPLINNILSPHRKGFNKIVSRKIIICNNLTAGIVMAEWKIIGLSGLLNAAITILLIILYYPLFFLGPLIGGFLASYRSAKYEDYTEMDVKDGAIVGVISGIIGGLIITLILITEFEAVTSLINLITLNVDLIPGDSVAIAAYIILQLSMIISITLGAIGGVMGIHAKNE